MAFDDYSQFPRGRKVVIGLNSTPVTLFATNTSVKITHIVFTGNNGAADREIIIRKDGGGANVVVLRAFHEFTHFIPGWQTDEDGLEALTDSATGDVDLFVYTVEPTIA